MVDELVELVQRYRHELHADPTVTLQRKVKPGVDSFRTRTHIFEESSIELDNARAVIGPHDHIQIHEQLLLLLVVHRAANALDRHDLAALLVVHFVHCAISTTPDLTLVDKVIGRKVIHLQQKLSIIHKRALCPV